MNKSKVFQTAEEVFGDNLVDIGIGGSLKSDIDTIVILDKIYTDQIKEYIAKAEKKTGQRVSVRAVTPMMMRTAFIDGKTATMLYKGCEFLRGSYTLSFEDLQKIRKPQIPLEVSDLICATVSGKIKEDKMINFLIQLLTICQ